ncbi:MAG: transglutaminase family protein [Pseudomonadota bacterium]|nr:transglutaminase family protein [Pseudomonadota bacterium]
MASSLTSLAVEHVTTYRYHKPVRFGLHRLMFRPREGHDVQVVEAGLDVNVPARIDWMQDTQSNSVTLVTPQAVAAELKLECHFKIEHHRVNSAQDLPLAPHAQRWPFDYSADERFDLSAMLEPHYPDPDGRLYEWMRPYLSRASRPDTKELLMSMAEAIKSGLKYEVRNEEGTQTPDQTLTRGSGSCRDYALLMMEAVRRLGMAGRFVSGYLYDPALDTGANEGVVGAGATHAWLDVYLPGAGWVPFDPTNAVFKGTNLIRVAFARDPKLAAPLTGSWFGNPSDYIGMDVKVSVRRVESQAPARRTTSAANER